MDKFDRWNELKKQIHKKEKILKFKEREIFFINLGKNIGYEQNGVGEDFLRPVLILKKYNKRFFLGVPLTTKLKNNKYYLQIGENSYAILSQVRVFDAKRLVYFVKRLNENKFYEVTEKVKNLLPQRESGLSSNFINNIISQKTIKLIKYSKEYEKIWDDFVKNSKNGTIFHTRRFLSYHPKDRFEDNSILIYKKNRLIGVFPAVEGENKIISHRGSTYGGLVVGVKNNLKDSLTMWEEIINYYQKTIEFRKSEYIFEKYPSREVIFAAKKLGFVEVNEELSTCLDLDFVKMSERRKRAIKKCSSLKVVIDDMNYEKYYEILKENLKSRYNTTPTHSLEEMKLLKELLPKNYLLITIYKDNEIIAGIWLVLATNKTAHTFYIAQNYDFSEYQPLSCVVKEIIEFLKEKSFKYLNFGISTENGGEYINRGLFEFKESFGGFGVSRFYFRRKV